MTVLIVVEEEFGFLIYSYLQVYRAGVAYG